MKNFMYLCLFSLMIAVVGCVSATVADGICDKQTVDFGTVPTIPAGTLPNVSVAVSLPPQTITMDLSKDITQVDKVADQLQATISSLMINNSSHDLDWVRSVDVQVAASDGSLPQAELGNGKFTGASSELDLNVTMDADTALHYLSNGSVTLTITVSGEVSSSTIPNGELTNDVQLCANVSGHFSK
jgi:hypothetical protein